KLDDDFNEVDGVLLDNQNIETIFQETHNIRVGGEYRVGAWYLRAGGRYSTSPYKDINIALNPEYIKTSYSGGIGYRENNVFIDFAFSQTLSDYKLMAYNHVDNMAEADIKNKINNFILTLGFKF
ncbi:MAG: hypothetical protein C0597_10185, partial [Marinilabiliales bacterium]